MPFWDRLSASFYGLDEALHIRRAVFFPQHPIILFSATEKVSLVLSMAEFVSGGSAPSFKPCYELFPRFVPVSSGIAQAVLNLIRNSTESFLPLS